MHLRFLNFLNMLVKDFVKLSLGAVIAHRMRSFLTALGIAVGIAAVVLLTSLGEGIHKFVLAEFTQFGTNLIGVVPGKTSTTGMSGAVISNVRPMSLEDGEALRRIPQVKAITAMVMGNAPVEYGKRSRRTTIYGVGHEMPAVWQFQVAVGRCLPPDDPRAARAFAVLGSKMKSELFRGVNPLGEYVRIGGERYRVIGVMEPKGQFLGFDLDDTVFIPVARAMEMFDRESVMEIDILYTAGVESKTIAEHTRQLLVARHG